MKEGGIILISRRALLGLPNIAVLPNTSSAGEPTAPAAQPPDPLLHLLRRITYGPRPADIAHARSLGYAALVEEQLAPETIDDAACEANLRNLAILTLDRRSVHQLGNDSHRAYRALAQAMILRGVHSKRQLYERMVEFWSDHFNVAGDDYLLDMVIFQREVIRPHALGTFRDLLMATARAPAMLYYLDNASNVAEHPNENYARELLELHTLGVDGGYTEGDVKEVARAFTGWTVHNGMADGFYFDPEQHDKGAKTILGHRLPANRGIEDGLHVLSILANHPTTARYICRKLCVRFVGDSPPPELVEGMAAAWLESKGEIRSVLRHLFLSPHFLGGAPKLRRPLDFLIAALRATGTEVTNFWALEEMLEDLGQRPYGWFPPNGYPDISGAWYSTSGLLARWNTAMRLTHSAYSDAGDSGWGVRAQLREHIGSTSTVGELVDMVAEQVFGVPLSSSYRQPFVDFASDGAGPDTPVTEFLLGGKLASLFGLMLASPLFQWR
jgi:uncharacterized protein (DUF1800 family)